MDNEKFNLLKAHVSGYTKKDGTAVKGHETKVPAAVRAAIANLTPHGDDEWDHSGGSSKISVGAHRAADSLDVLGDHGFSLTGGANDEMKHPDGHTATVSGGTLTIKHGAAKVDLVKSHVDQYTKTDGTVVRAHDDKRVAAAPKNQPMTSEQKHKNYVSANKLHMSMKNSEHVARKPINHHEVHNIPESAKLKQEDVNAAGLPEFTHHDVYGLENADLSGDFSQKFKNEGHEGFILNHQDGSRSVVNTEGYNYARYVAPIEKRNQANPPASSGGPSGGDVGSEEHKTYGKYFKNGDKVKDGSGNQHTVVDHHGPVVRTESGKTFHPTKLDRA